MVVVCEFDLVGFWVDLVDLVLAGWWWFPLLGRKLHLYILRMPQL